MPRLLAVVTALVLAPSPLAAQISVYAVHGIGFPGRPLSARARALGGGSAMFDPVSAINPAAASGFARVTAMAVASGEFRSYDIGGITASGLRNARFPLALVGGRISRRLGFAVSFGNYAERTFDITTSDTIPLRGAPVAVEDRIVSDGGVVDIRGALSWTLNDRFRLGVSGHVLSGSAKLEVRRQFGDSAFRSFRQQGDASFSGNSVAGGFLWTVLEGLRLAGTVRFDSRLETSVDSVPSGEFDLPVTVAGGLELAPHRAMRIAVSGQWRSWSDAANDVAASGATAFDTWEVGAGLEIGGAETGTSRVPLRLGFRYAQLPFAPDADQPREINLAVGTGLLFANNRGLLDVALERVLRDGADLRERSWHLSVGMTVRP